MALPTAPLGQLGNMSMPYSIPSYDKGPSIWEKALAAFLVNAAGGVASRGTENLMSRDYAKEFGEKPAGTWGRLVGGPAVGEADAKQRRQNVFVSTEAQKGRDATREESDFDRMFKGTQDEAAAKNRLLQQDAATQAGFDETALRDMNALIRGDRAETGATQRNTDDNAARLAQTKAEYGLRAGLPSEQKDKMIIDMIRQRMSPGTGTTAPPPAQPINPNIRADAAGASLPPQPPVDQGGFPDMPQFVSNEDDVAAMLAQGMTPEQIIKIVQRQQSVSKLAQSRPLSSTNTNPMRNPYAQPAAPTASPELLHILEKTGLLHRPSLYSGQPDLGIYNP